MNRSLEGIAPHASKRISDAVAGHPKVIDLTVGVPDFGPPDTVLARLQSSLSDRSPRVASFNRYAPSKGLKHLREEIAQRYRRRYDLRVDPDSEVLVTNGGAEALWLSIFTLTNPGDEVLMADPCYILYDPIVRGLGRRSVRIRTTDQNGHLLRAEELDRHAGPRAKLVLVNSPENPTGAVYDRSDLAAISAAAETRCLYVVHDEVFDDFVFQGEHVPMLTVSTDRDRTIMVNSFSKRFGMSGWRLGWLVGPKEVVSEAAKAHTYLSLAVNTLAQETVLGALNDPAVEAEVRARADELSRRACTYWEAFTAITGTTGERTPPCGGFYLFPRVVSLCERLVGRKRAWNESVGEAVARVLLEKGEIAVVPGSAFGAGGVEHIRISIAAPEWKLQESLRRLQLVIDGVRV